MNPDAISALYVASKPIGYSGGKLVNIVYVR